MALDTAAGRQAELGRTADAIGPGAQLGARDPRPARVLDPGAARAGRGRAAGRSPSSRRPRAVLRPALDALRPLAAEARRLAAPLREQLRALRPVIDAALPVARELPAVLNGLTPLLDHLRARAPEVIGFFTLLGDATSNYDVNGNLVRVSSILIQFNAPPGRDRRLERRRRLARAPVRPQPGHCRGRALGALLAQLHRRRQAAAQLPRRVGDAMRRSPIGRSRVPPLLRRLCRERADGAARRRRDGRPARGHARRRLDHLASAAAPERRCGRSSTTSTRCSPGCTCGSTARSRARWATSRSPTRAPRWSRWSCSRAPRRRTPTPPPRSASRTSPATATSRSSRARPPSRSARRRSGMRSTVVAPRFDDLLNSFNEPVRQGLELLLIELGKGLERRGDDLNTADPRAAPRARGRRRGAGRGPLAERRAAQPDRRRRGGHRAGRGTLARARRAGRPL